MTTTRDPRQALADLRAALDAATAGFLAERRGAMEHMAPGSTPLLDLVEGAGAAGGKRLRPVLCWCAYRACGGRGAESAILRAAGSLELLHTFAILHDDVMDQATLRRGHPALHRRLAAERLAAGYERDADAYGVSIAVLAGDLALVLSDAMLARSGFSAEAIARASGPLALMRMQAVTGQYLDLAQSSGRPVPASEAVRIERLKTAGYSVAGPVAFGAALAGGDPSIPAALERWAVAVGEAFFLSDELIGLFGDPAVTGKDVCSDLRRGKPTVLVARALEMASAADREAIAGRWGNPMATAGDLDAVRTAVLASGAGAAVRAEIGRLLDGAWSVLVDAEFQDPEAWGILRLLAEGLRPGA